MFILNDILGILKIGWGKETRKKKYKIPKNETQANDVNSPENAYGKISSSAR